MQANEEHSQAFDDVQMTWEMCDEVRERPVIQALLKDLDVPTKRESRNSRFSLIWGTAPRRFTMAAVVLLVAAVVVAVVMRTRPVTLEYATAVGEQRVETLADGSTISLNTATRVQVRYSRNIRRIELSSGEALFNVTKDSRRPFEVHALQGTVTAVGTEFDVQITQSAAAVSVLSGTVTVRADSRSQVGDPTKVSGGQAVDFTTDGGTSAVRVADIDKVRAWQAHRIVFSNVTLSDALLEYNRYITTPIVIGDANLGTRRINGVFRIGEPASFLNALEQGLHTTAVRTDSAIILQPR
jgi:transmembrane sensor